MNDDPHPTSEANSFVPQSGWANKFYCAARGIVVGVRTQSSFWVHLPAAAFVMAVAAWRGVTITQGLLLVFAITMVLAAELFNTALEALARAVTHETNPHVRDALDSAAGGVLITAIGAAVVGVFILIL